MVKTNLFFGTMPFNLWAMLAMWLPLGAPHKIKRNWIYNLLQQISIVDTYRIKIGHAWCG
jgi:hypothetical protein